LILGRGIEFLFFESEPGSSSKIPDDHSYGHEGKSGVTGKVREKVQEWRDNGEGKSG
jgi:hypothetical protein